MDRALQELMSIAAKRGNKYVKGDAAVDGLQSKMAELGVLLLEKARRLPGLDDAKTREELIEVQNKLDDLRKAIFANKVQLR
ncbi:MAG: hypothetical protein M0Z60_11060 [Nitrospiraceae bacterium]|nr:hypothetical protein [Nitrospiraceae bacterium]